MSVAPIQLRPGSARLASRRSPRRGFTLIEAAMTTVIIGLGVVAMLELLARGTMVNVHGTEITTAMNLAKNIRERTLQAPFDTLTSFNGQSITPPVDSRGVTLSGLTGWQQQIAVQPVDPERLTTNITDSTPQAVRITTTISHNGRVIRDLTWYCFDGTP
jgi:Tfp pilus assembly protein PilV